MPKRGVAVEGAIREKKFLMRGRVHIRRSKRKKQSRNLQRAEQKVKSVCRANSEFPGAFRVAYYRHTLDAPG